MVRIFRSDDVSMNTNLSHLEEMYDIMRSFEPKAEIYHAVTVFSKYAKNGAVYPRLPLKDRSFEYFLDVDQVMSCSPLHDVRVVSHGLWHFDHGKMSREVQMASIISSCRLLNTDIFVPPFNNYNSATEEICKDNGIQLVRFSEGWKSLEFNEYDPKHPLWYFHSWKWTPKKLEEHLAHGYAHSK